MTDSDKILRLSGSIIVLACRYKTDGGYSPYCHTVTAGRNPPSIHRRAALWTLYECLCNIVIVCDILLHSVPTVPTLHLCLFQLWSELLMMPPPLSLVRGNFNSPQHVLTLMRRCGIQKTYTIMTLS